MTQMDLFQTATSSPQDIRASLSVLPGSEEAQKMTDISGRTYFPLFKKNDALGVFSRMFLGTSLWGSTRCYLTWKGKATPRGRLLFQLVPRTHLIAEIESSSSVEMWPTPTASDYKGSGPTIIRSDGKSRLNDRLDYAVEQRQNAPSGSLNPQFVEWLMGYPIGWTSLETSQE